MLVLGVGERESQGILREGRADGKDEGYAKRGELGTMFTPREPDSDAVRCWTCLQVRSFFFDKGVDVELGWLRCTSRALTPGPKPSIYRIRTSTHRTSTPLDHLIKSINDDL